MIKIAATYKIYSLSLLFLIGITFLGYIPDQSDFIKIIVAYSFCFIAYLLLLRSNSQVNTILGLCILSRFILIFAFPNLSDDIYRFIWDGRLIHAGISPYQDIPVDVVGMSNNLDTTLLDKLNSPNYFSLYPPIAQLFNYISTIVSTQTLIGESIIYKSLLFLSDMALMKLIVLLLQQFSLAKERLFLYALNPLIIIEIMGNVHFEGVMISFLALSLLYIGKRQWSYSGVSLAMSIGSKMLPLMFSLAYFFYLRIGRWTLVLATIVTSIILFAPILFSTDFFNIATSLDLYVKKFEFNGSIYYLLRAIGYKVYGYNTIHIWGPALSVATILSIAYISYIKRYHKTVSLIQVILFCTTIFLLTSRTVHPWYLSLALFACIFTRFRYPIVWSYLIFSTYINYSYAEYYENLWMVMLEYTIVYSYMIYELWNNKKAPVILTEA